MGLQITQQKKSNRHGRNSGNQTNLHNLLGISGSLEIPNSKRS